jgi:hypothetical protein
MFSVRKRTFVLRTEVCFVTWSRSRIMDHTEFYKLLQLHMPAGTKIFGCQELHQDGTPHYHAVMKFPERVNWPDARKTFMLLLDDGTIDTQSINIEVPARGQSIEDFLQRTQDYSSKAPEYLFGKVISVSRCCEDCQRSLGSDAKVYCGSCVEAKAHRQVCLLPGNSPTATLKD